MRNGSFRRLQTLKGKAKHRHLDELREDKKTARLLGSHIRFLKHAYSVLPLSTSLWRPVEAYVNYGL